MAIVSEAFVTAAVGASSGSGSLRNFFLLFGGMGRIQASVTAYQGILDR